MSATLDLVSNKLFGEIQQEYEKYGELSDSHLSALSCLFGQPVLSALDLVDNSAVSHCISPKGEEVYQIRSNSGRVYTCPVSLQFCPCMSFAFGVIKRGELITKDMEKSALCFIVFFFCVVLYQVSVWPLLFTITIFCVSTCATLYILVVNGTLLPIEAAIMHLYLQVSSTKPPSIVAMEATSHEDTTDSHFDDEITRKLREITGHIVRDFILDWYNTVSDNVEFVQEAFEIFEHVLTEVRSRVTHVNPQTFVQVLLCRLKRHYSCYKQSAAYAFSLHSDDARKEQNVVVNYEKLNGHLAMSNLPDTESDHLRSVVAILLKGLLPCEYKLSGTSMYLVRELISRNVLLAMVDMMTDPDWINMVLVRILGDEEVIDSSRSTSAESSDVEVDDPPPPASVEEDEEEEDEDPPLAAPTLLSVRYSASHSIDEIKIALTSSVRSSSQQHPSDPRDPPNSYDPVVEHPDATDDVVVNRNYNNQNKQPNTLLTHQFPFLQPSKDRFFRHIRIQEANAVDELFEGGRRYTLYKITYFAPPNNPQQHRETHNFTSGRLDGRLGGTEADLHEFQVRRRFREFLVLQDRLNEKRNIKKMMLKIRGPSRMFPMPIGNLDEGYIEKRRKLLQAFLRELCSHPEISETTELQQFLAYNTDPRIAYVRKSSDYIPRFDKMFKNAVQELIGAAGHKFSDKFPSDVENELMNNRLVPSKSMPTLPMSDAGNKARNLGPVTRFKKRVLGKHPGADKHEGVRREFAAFAGPCNPNRVTFGRRWRSPENLLMNRTRFCAMSGGRRTCGDGCDNFPGLESTHGSGILGAHLLAGQIFQAAKTLWGIPMGKLTLSVVVTARFVQQYVGLKMEYLLQRDRWLHYLKTFQQSLWPSGQWAEVKSEETKNSKELFQKALIVLEETFPDVLRVVVGEEGYKRNIENLLQSFQQPVINRHLMYHLVDSALQLLFPDFQNILASRRNISL